VPVYYSVQVYTYIPYYVQYLIYYEVDYYYIVPVDLNYYVSYYVPVYYQVIHYVYVDNYYDFVIYYQVPVTGKGFDYSWAHYYDVTPDHCNTYYHINYGEAYYRQIQTYYY